MQLLPIIRWPLVAAFILVLSGSYAYRMRHLPPAVPSVPTMTYLARDISPVLPTVLTVSETVVNGETMNVQGGGFALAATVQLQLVKADGTADPSQNRSLKIANQSTYLIQAVVPVDMPAGLWAVTVTNPDGSVSNPRYVHQARGNGYDNHEVAAGSKLRVRGRNMVAPGGDFHASYVTFSSGSTVLTAMATAGDAYGMSVIVPSGVSVGTTYVVKVSNGLGGQAGENTVPYPLAIRAGGADPFALGEPWGADFVPVAANVYDVTSDSRLTLHAVGDGTTDNLAAIQAASIKASQAGGGTLYFPAGTYIVDNVTSSLYLYPKVVLKGAGQSQTTFKYALHPDNNQYFAVIDDAGTVGFLDLTVQDMNTGTTHSNAILTQYAAKSKEVFFKDITFHMGSGATYGVGCYCDRALMTGSTITDQSNTSAPVGFSGNDVEVSNNTITFGGSRNEFNVDNLTIENNTIHRDGNLDYPQQHEDGGLELSFSRNAEVTNNDVEVTGQISQNNNSFGSNELIMTQNSVYALGILGTATASTSTSLSDSGKDWSAPETLYPYRNVNVEFLQHDIVSIIAGTGIGQWRDVTGNSANSLNVDHPWQIQPDATSKYVVTLWSAERFDIRNNTIVNGKLGVELYSGVVDTVVDGNRMTNTGGIFMMGWHDTVTPPPGQLSNYLALNNLITNNVITDTTGVGAPLYIYVGGTENYPGTALAGIISYGNEVRGNSLVSTNPPIQGAGPYQLGGYYNYIYEGGGTSSDAAGVGVIGSIFEKNGATNLPIQPYVSLGTSQNTAHYVGEPARMPCLNLSLTDRPAANQAIAGVQVKYFKAGTESLAARTENWPSATDGKTILNDPFLVGSQAGYWVQYPTVFRDLGTYDVWVKAPGYLAKKIPGVTNAQTVCVSMPTGLLAGDFTTNDQNTVTIGDLVTAIRSYKGGTDDAANLATAAFGHVPGFGDLITVIRHFNQNPVGDQP